MLPVLQWPEDGNNFRNPRQMSLSCLGGAFLFMAEMKNKLLLLFLLFCVACSDMGTNPKEEEIPETVSYKNDIQPLLNSGCVNCHGNQGQLSLATYAKTMKGGKSGEVVIPKNSAGSLLIKKLKGEASGQRMPPKPQSPWADNKIELVTKWINSGAEDN